MNSSSGSRAAGYVVALIVVCFATAFAAGQSAPPPASRTRYTVAQALAAAKANYPRIRTALEQQLAARGGIAVARTAYLPRADMLWQTNRATANNIYGLLLSQGNVPAISGPVIAADNSRSAWSSAGGLLLSWQPFDFGLRNAQVSVAQQGAMVAAAGLNLTLLDVQIATANAYFDLATAEKFASIAEANVNRLQVFVNSVHVLVKNQLRPGADAAQADASLAVAHTQFIQARTNVEVRRAALADFLGSSGTKVELDDARLLVLPSMEGPATTPLSTHPLAEQQAAIVDQRQAQVSVLAHSYAPQFNLEGSLSGRGAGTALTGLFRGGTNGLAPDTLNWAAGVQVTFAAFDLFSLRAEKKAQEANVRAEQARYEQTLDDLSALVRQAQAQLDGARAAAENTPVELSAARQSESQQHARFEASLATVIDVAAAESLLVQAEADDAVARLNVWRALAGLAAARGDLQPFIAQLQQP